jgi:hypothetical protein
VPKENLQTSYKTLRNHFHCVALVVEDQYLSYWDSSSIVPKACYDNVVAPQAYAFLSAAIFSSEALLFASALLF